VDAGVTTAVPPAKASWLFQRTRTIPLGHRIMTGAPLLRRGQQHRTCGSSEWIFTSYQHDPETALEYALARYYDTRTGGFCSADPVEGDPGNPESWNRYAYAQDDPISIADPSGQFSLFDVFKLIGLIWRNTTTHRMGNAPAGRAHFRWNPWSCALKDDRTGSRSSCFRSPPPATGHFRK
jgi:RHS repeat-associated protein